MAHNKCNSQDAHGTNNIFPPPNPHFIETLEKIVKESSSKTFSTWYDKHGNASDQYTYGQIWTEAGAIAHTLRIDMGLKKGDRVVLCYNFGLQFFATFLGCLRAGITAVLVYPPNPSSLSTTIPKTTTVASDCDAKYILVDSDISRMRTLDLANPISKSRHLWPRDIKFKNLHQDVKVKLSKKSSVSFDEKELRADDIAFFQYTSGSTGKPKGVMVSFGSLEANVNVIHNYAKKECAKVGLPFCDIVTLSWVPQYHDLGLICATIAPFAGGWNCNYFSPITFVKDPVLYIKLMSKLKINLSFGPDFGYNLAARKFNEMKKANGGREPIPDLDLSSVIFLQNGAEPIRQETKELFEDTFLKYNLNEHWFYASFGMAEMVVCISSLREFKLSRFEPTPGCRSIAVAHRTLLPANHDLRIVCPSTLRELEDGKVGELWIHGPSAASGYFNKPELTKDVFNAKIQDVLNGDETVTNTKFYVRSGDLAFFEDDYLYICGRQKDLVIVNGVNYYPQDIEHAAQNATPAVRPGCVAAFSSDDTGNDGDLEVVFEVRKDYIKDVADIVSTIRMKIVEEIGLIPARIVAIREKTILKTTSGKIQRKKNRKALHEGSLDIIYDYTTSLMTKELPLKGGLASDQIGNENDMNTFKEDFEERFDRIAASFIGNTYDSSQTWDELGLSSMASVQMRDSITNQYAITLSPDCFDLYPTPKALREFVSGNQGSPLEIDLPTLSRLDSISLSWIVMGCLQGLCSIFLLFVFAFPIVPAWYAWKWMVDINASLTIPALGGTEIDIVWIWMPIVLPTWMLAMSFSVVIMKWTFIWKYKEGIVSIPSFSYLRWWFIDRAVTLWEFWVGRFIKDTPLINAFYVLMGAKIHSSAVLDSFIREFDLVTIGKDVSLEHSINCRRFGKWDHVEGPSLRYRSIIIGSNCAVKGMVSLGSSIGAGTRVEKLSVVPEGALVPKDAVVLGNPAFVCTNMNASQGMPANKHVYSLGILKIVWLIVELYIFFGITILGQYLWFSRLPNNWRYALVFKWFLLLIWFSILSTLLSVMMKWTLIGKRKKGPSSDSLWRTFADWAADWHYGVSVEFLYSLSQYSRVWNIVLWLHGMNIDFRSQFLVVDYPPSVMDLVRIRKSFLSAVSMTIKGKNGYHCMDIKNSSIGYCAHLEPVEKNMELSNTIIPPLSCVTKSVTRDSPNYERGVVADVSTRQLLLNEAIRSALYVISWSIIFCTLLPPYEVWMNCFGNPTSIWMAVPALASALAVQTISWVVLFAVLQNIALFKYSEESEEPWSKQLFTMYAEMSYNLQVFSFMRVVMGSPVYNFLVKIMGGKIDGRVILLPQRLHEISYLTFENETIVDSAHITGHHVVYNDITLGPSHISGILHEGTYAANSNVDGIFESEPCWRAFVGSGSTDRIAGKNPELSITNTFQTNSSSKLGSTDSFDDVVDLENGL